MQSRAVEAGRGWQWIVDGFVLFRKNPLVWIALTVLLALLWIVSVAIPLLGPLLFTLLTPAFIAGLMIGCRALEQNEELAIAHLFAGFRHGGPLVTIGGIYLVGNILVIGVVLLLSGGSPLPSISKSATDIDALNAALRSMALPLAIGAALYVPLLMLTWFAPLLVVFNGLPPAEAMKLSFAACLKNLLPFLVYGIVLLVLSFIASIPLLLGLLIFLPVLFCSIYASYKDIFAAAGSPAAPTSDNPFLR